MVGYGLGITMLEAGLTSPLYGLYQHQFGFSTGMLTVAFAQYSFTLLPALLICGPWSDLAGRRPVLLAGLALTVLAAVAVSFPAASLVVLFCGALLAGAGLGLTFLAAPTVINHLAPIEQRGGVIAEF